MKDVIVYYVNDTGATQYLYVHTLTHLRKELAPQESIKVSIAIADDQGVFVKSWGHKVLIGRTDL